MKECKRYYKIYGAGPLIEVSELEYIEILEKNCRPEFHEQMNQPMHGIVTRHATYLCIGD